MVAVAVARAEEVTTMPVPFIRPRGGHYPAADGRIQSYAHEASAIRK